MSFTRFHDDPERIKKQAQESSDVGRYWLNTPGQGVNIGFVEDAHIRLQGWGANLRNNTVELESDLKGITRRRRQVPSSILLIGGRRLQDMKNLPVILNVS